MDAALTRNQINYFRSEIINKYEQQFMQMQRDLFTCVQAQLEDVLTKQAEREKRIVLQIQDLTGQQLRMAQDSSALGKTLGSCS